MKLSNVSMRAMLVAIRWCRRAGYPNALSDWTEEQNLMIQIVAQEWDNRQLRSICK